MKSTLIALSLLIAGSGYGQLSFTLKQAQQYAMENAVANKNAKLDVAAAKAKINEVTASGLPQVSASGSYQNFPNIPTTLLPAEFSGGPPGTYVPVRFGLPQSLSASVNASQLIFNGSYFVGLQASKAFLDLAKNQQARTEIQVRLDVANAYHIVIAAQENLVTLEKSKTTLDRVYKETLALYQSGLAEEQDADQLKINYTNIENAYENAAQQVTLAKNLLKFHMGVPLTTEIILTDNIQTLTSLEGASLLEINTDYRDNIEYKLAINNLAMQTQNLRSKKAGYLPTLSAFASQQATAFGDKNFDFFKSDKQYFPTTVWGINLSIPIFSSFQRSNQVKQAALEVEKAKNMEVLAREGVLLEQQNARNDYKFQWKNFNAQKENLALAQRVKEKTIIKFKEGVASSFELSQIESQYLQAQGSYIQAMINLLNAKTRLEKALSKL